MASALPTTALPEKVAIPASLAGSERAQAQWKLEGNFASFEALPTFQHRGDGRTPPPPQPRPGG